jgi:predicted nuclease of predicted toxin-antitoxin system
MKFLLDESVEFRLHSYLQELGHDVTSVAKDYLYGLLDEDVLVMATQERRILITNDKDFGELIFRHQFPHSGVILLRMKDANVKAKLTRLQEVITEFADRLDQFLVVTQKTVRVRKIQKILSPAA